MGEVRVCYVPLSREAPSLSPAHDIAGGTCDQAELKCPDQIEKEPVLFGLGARRVADFLRPHVADVYGQRINDVVAPDDLMSADIGAAFCIVAKVIVVQATPKRSSFDVFVVVGELPI